MIGLIYDRSMRFMTDQREAGSVYSCLALALDDDDDSDGDNSDVMMMMMLNSRLKSIEEVLTFASRWQP